MNKLLLQSRYIVVIGVLSLLLSSVAAFGWSVVKAITAIYTIFVSYGQNSHIAIDLIEVVDVTLIATVLLISAVSIYDIFVGDIELPPGMVARNIYELKGKLSSVIVLVMAIKFLEHLAEWKDATATLYYGIAIAAVSATLIALSYQGGKE
jgi:uncharacterized membrane protein YqhA